MATQGKTKLFKPSRPKEKQKLDETMDVDHDRPRRPTSAHEDAPAPSSKTGAPEDEWAAMWHGGMLNVSLSQGEEPLPAKARPKVPTKKIDGAPSAPSAPSSQDKSGASETKSTQQVNTSNPSQLGHDLGAVPDSMHDRAEWLDGIFRSHLHSLNAVRISEGLIESHIQDLMWFQERLAEHHTTLLRMRNLQQKMVEGVSRAIYTRGKQQDVRIALDDAKEGE